jgi:hypothetical protein
MKAHTKEEKLLIALHEEALALGDPETEVDRYKVGQNIGLHPRGIDTICNELAQANFIKKRGPELLFVTDNGRRLIQEILRE